MIVNSKMNKVNTCHVLLEIHVMYINICT